MLGIDSQPSTPERRLLAALLERAILDFVGNDLPEVGAAKEWLFDWLDEEQSDEERDEHRYKEFSFRWVCHHLDLNPYKVADFVHAMPKRGSRRIAPWYFKSEDGGGQPDRMFASVR